MKHLLGLLTVSLALHCGCAPGFVVRHHEPLVVERSAASEWAPEAADKLVGKDVQVGLQSGWTCGGEVIELNAEQMTLRDGSYATARLIPMDSVLRIGSPPNDGWVILGAVGVGIIGGLAGVEAGKALDPKKGGLESIGESMLMVTMGGAIGAVLGMIVGRTILDVATYTPSYTLLKTPGPPQVLPAKKENGPQRK